MGLSAGGAASSEPADDPDGVLLGGWVAPPQAGDAARRRPAGRPRAAPVSGRFLAWVTGNPECMPLPPEGDAPAPAVSSGLSVLGIVDYTWSYRHVATDDVEWQNVLAVEGASRRQQPAWGVLTYKAVEVWPLIEVFPLAGADLDLEHAATPALLFEELRQRLVPKPNGDICTVEQICNENEDVDVVLQEDSVCTERLMTWALPYTFRSVRLGTVVPWAQLIVGHPLRSYVNRWKADVGANKVMGARKRGGTPAVDELVLAMPKRRRVETVEGAGASAKRPFNPLRWIRCAYFSNYLKDQRDFTAAMGAAHAVDHSDEESGDRDATRDPGASTLRRTFGKMDVLDQLLWRREFHAARVHDLLFAINLYTDSSPVSGHELQGLLADVSWKNGREERVVLPGSSLAYGLFDAVNKTIGMVHALWLLSGPEYEDVWYICSKVVSVTTDMGVERETLTLPNMVRAYCQFMAGTPFERCGQSVDRSERWIKHALRVGGWSHAWGNIAKAVANKVDRWPASLEEMRNLVAFWRVDTWRSHVTTMLKREHAENELVVESSKFRATFAKWRYETIALAMCELLRLRRICQRHIRVEWFSNPQDGEQLQGVLHACTDEWLWRFMEASYRECFSEIESSRHWGMVCTHEACQQKRRDGAKHVPCFGNSRRLDEAWQFVQDQALKWDERARHLTDEDCENDRALRKTIQHMLRQTASYARHRFAYLGDPPWSASRCETVEGTHNFISQVDAVPIEQHDPLTRDILQRVGECIRKRARGEDVEPPLRDECKRLKTAPLNEDPGEGVHRSANKELTRADASSTIALKQKCRRAGSFGHIKSFVRRYGKRGEQIVAWEFANWKRILQASPRRK